MSATILSRHLRRTLSPISTFFAHHHRIPCPTSTLSLPRPFSTAPKSSWNYDDKFVKQLLADVEAEKSREREARKVAGLDTADIDAEEHEDYMGIGPRIAKLEKLNLKDANSPDLYKFEEPTDTEDSDEETREEFEKRKSMFEKKFKRHEELLRNFVDAGN